MKPGRLAGILTILICIHVAFEGLLLGGIHFSQNRILPFLEISIYLLIYFYVAKRYKPSLYVWPYLTYGGFTVLEVVLISTLDYSDPSKTYFFNLLINFLIFSLPGFVAVVSRLFIAYHFRSIEQMKLISRAIIGEIILQFVLLSIPFSFQEEPDWFFKLAAATTTIPFLFMLVKLTQDRIASKIPVEPEQ